MFVMNIYPIMNLLTNVLKYVLEGLAVAVAAYFIPQKQTDPLEILYIALTAAATFAVLDLLAPSVSMGARQGTGFGVGLNQVGWQAGGYDQAQVPVSDKDDQSTSSGSSSAKSE